MNASLNPREKPMSEDISKTFAAQLLDLREQLIARLRAQRGGERSAVEAAAQARDESSDDWATANRERDLDFALQAHEAEELEAIDAALDRIADGTYGVCEDCGCDIPTARLHANPFTARCIDCQARAET